MTDDSGRQLTPQGPDGSELVPPAADVTPVPDAETRAVERFSAGPRAHMVELTEERSAQIVRQSGNARNWAFLAVLVVALIIPVYWFYDMGISAVGATGRMKQTAERQVVTDVERGYSLYIANCARCHGEDGKGGIGPPLNDQAKLYQAVTPEGLPGPGHLNPNYLDNVLTVGGRYVCGNPESLMAAWKQPNGPLNYRQVEELIAWITASSDVEFEYKPATHEANAPPVEPVTVHGWRDPSWKPAPDATPVPACWTRPEGQAAASPAAQGGGAAAIENPGTAEAPRVIKLDETATLQITDPAGAQVTQIPVKAGETVTFEVTNTAGFDHNFFIGTAEELQVPGAATDVGIPTFSEGTKSVTWTVPSEGAFQFACTVPGHYQPMHGDFVIVQ